MTDPTTPTPPATAKSAKEVIERAISNAEAHVDMCDIGAGGLRASVAELRALLDAPTNAVEKLCTLVEDALSLRNDLTREEESAIRSALAAVRASPEAVGATLGVEVPVGSLPVGSLYCNDVGIVSVRVPDSAFREARSSSDTARFDLGDDRVRLMGATQKVRPLTLVVASPEAVGGGLAPTMLEQRDEARKALADEQFAARTLRNELDTARKLLLDANADWSRKVGALMTERDSLKADLAAARGEVERAKADPGAPDWKPIGSSWPAERRCVLVQIAPSDKEGHAPAVGVGYMREQSSGPYFVVPGARTGFVVTHWADCLGDDFHARPNWMMRDQPGSKRAKDERHATPPPAIRVPCTANGCRWDTTDPSGRCAAHRDGWAEKVTPATPPPATEAPISERAAKFRAELDFVEEERVRKMREDQEDRQAWLRDNAARVRQLEIDHARLVGAPTLRALAIFEGAMKLAAADAHPDTHAAPSPWIVSTGIADARRDDNIARYVAASAQILAAAERAAKAPAPADG